MTVDSNFKECIFCHQKAPYAPLEEMSKHGFRIYFCHPCQVEYIVLWLPNSQKSLDENFRYNIYTKIDNRIFKVSVNKHNDMQVFQVGIPGTPGISLNKNCVMVLYFKSGLAPNLTPSNINEKLRTYIIFS